MADLMDLVKGAVQVVKQVAKTVESVQTPDVKTVSEVESSTSVITSDSAQSRAQENSEILENTLSLFDNDSELKQEVESVSSSASSSVSDKEDDKVAQDELKKAEEEAQKEAEKMGMESYEDFEAHLQDAGLKTSVREGKMTFDEYAGAISEEVAQELIDSFDCEEDYILQQEIAAIFTQYDSISISDFMGILRDRGYKVERESVKTSYIIDDNKSKSHHGGEYVENGSLTMLTIRDPRTGAEIKILDANGNGAIETEELFLNELLTNVACQIDPNNYERLSNVHIDKNSTNGDLISNFEANNKKELEESQSEKFDDSGKKKLNATDYGTVLRQKIQEFVQNGIDYQVAVEKAKAYMSQNYVIDATVKSQGAGLESMAA